MAAASPLTSLVDGFTSVAKQFARDRDVRLSFAEFCEKLKPWLQQTEYGELSIALYLNNRVHLTVELLTVLKLTNRTETAIEVKKNIVRLLDEQPLLAYCEIPSSSTTFHIVLDGATFRTLLQRIGSEQAKHILVQNVQHQEILQTTYYNYLVAWESGQASSAPGRSVNTSSIDVRSSSPAAHHSRLLYQATLSLLNAMSQVHKNLEELRVGNARERELAATERMMNLQRWESLFHHMVELRATMPRHQESGPLDLCTKTAAPRAGDDEAAEKPKTCSIGTHLHLSVFLYVCIIYIFRTSQGRVFSLFCRNICHAHTWKLVSDVPTGGWLAKGQTRTL